MTALQSAMRKLERAEETQVFLTLEEAKALLTKFADLEEQVSVLEDTLQSSYEREGY